MPNPQYADMIYGEAMDPVAIVAKKPLSPYQKMVSDWSSNVLKNASSNL
jgi:hypothetical protein